jgi:hypothetical protein
VVLPLGGHAEPSFDKAELAGASSAKDIDAIGGSDEDIEVSVAI